MKLAYLTSRFPGTSHTFISREVAALRNLGVDVETFSIRAPYPAEMEDESLAEQARNTFTVLDQPWTTFAGAHLRAFGTNPGAYLRTFILALRHRPPGARPFALALAHFAEAVVLARELQRRRITRLHNHFANSGANVGYLAASFGELPWSFTMHGISETDYPAGLTLARKIEAAEFVACVSYFGRAQAMRLVSPEQWHKLQIVRCGLPVEEMPQRSSAQTVRRLICVGRLAPEKGQAGLLEAFALLLRKGGKVELVFVGDGPAGPELRERAKALGLDHKVRFAGRAGEQQTLAEIAGSSILVLPSFMEGLPIVLMEAMAIGIPVVASRVAGIPELVSDGNSGLLFTPSAWEELAACIDRLLSDDGLGERLADAGRKVVRDEFDIRTSAENLRDLFARGSRSQEAS